MPRPNIIQNQPRTTFLDLRKKITNIRSCEHWTAKSKIYVCPEQLWFLRKYM